MDQRGSENLLSTLIYAVFIEYHVPLAVVVAVLAGAVLETVFEAVTGVIFLPVPDEVDFFGGMA